MSRTVWIPARATVDGEPVLVGGVKLTILDPPPASPLLGYAVAQTTSGADWTPKPGAVPPGRRIYGGVDRGVLQWGDPWTPDVTTFEFRTRKKPTVACHPFVGSGSTCTSCGKVLSDQCHDDAIAKVLSGQYDALIRQAADTIKAQGRRLLGTLEHEWLQSEFFPGQSWGDVAACAAHVIDVMAARGVTNVDWYSCPLGSQYPAIADQLHTPALLSKLTGIGADIYFQPTADLTKGSWAAFSASHPEKPHAVFECGLWNGTAAAQASFLQAVPAWYKTHPNYSAFYGFFRQDQAAGHDGRLIVSQGVAAWDAVVADPFFGRTP